MSEKLHAPKQEHLNHHESVEKAKEHLDKLRELAEEDNGKHLESGRLEKIQKSVETHAISGKEMTPSESNKDSAPGTGYVNRELKELSFKRSLNTARRQLKAPERTLSKVIHNPIVEKVSDVAGATVARPSGIVGGGLFAFVGSAALLWITKKYGYEYNYLVFFMLFVGGFMLGMIAELGFKYWRRTHKKSRA